LIWINGRWRTAAPLRYLADTIGTVLLTAALMLMTIVEQYPFVHGWLTVLLMVYIALGMAAFWSRKRRGVRIACWLAALAVYLFIVSVARAHHPLGIFSGTCTSRYPGKASEVIPRELRLRLFLLAVMEVVQRRAEQAHLLLQRRDRAHQLYARPFQLRPARQRRCKGAAARDDVEVGVLDLTVTMRPDMPVRS
jgi:uncharacterized membrane protein SirB2